MDGQENAFINQRFLETAMQRSFRTAQRHVNRHKARGFSLLECGVTAAILATLTIVAAPSWDTMFDLLRPNATSVLKAHMLLARSEAIKSQSRAVVCKSNDGQMCTTQGSWTQGWIVFRDTDNNGQRGHDEALVSVNSALPKDVIFTGNGSMARYVSFQPDGTPAQVSGAFQAGTLTICRRSDRATSAHTLVMNATGRIRLSKGSIQQCV